MNHYNKLIFALNHDHDIDIIKEIIKNIEYDVTLFTKLIHNIKNYDNIEIILLFCDKINIINKHDIVLAIDILSNNNNEKIINLFINKIIVNRSILNNINFLSIYQRIKNDIYFIKLIIDNNILISDNDIYRIIILLLECQSNASIIDNIITKYLDNNIIFNKNHYNNKTIFMTSIIYKINFNLLIKIMKKTTDFTHKNYNGRDCFDLAMKYYPKLIPYLLHLYNINVNKIILQ